MKKYLITGGDGRFAKELKKKVLMEKKSLFI